MADCQKGIRRLVRKVLKAKTRAYSCVFLRQDLEICPTSDVIDNAPRSESESGSNSLPLLGLNFPIRPDRYSPNFHLINISYAQSRPKMAPFPKLSSEIISRARASPVHIPRVPAYVNALLMMKTSSCGGTSNPWAWNML